MNINISREMAEAVVSALEKDRRNGLKTYGNPDDYTVSNQEALEFFTEILEIQIRLVPPPKNSSGRKKAENI